MSVTTVVAGKKAGGGGESKRRSGYMTTTELAKLCGVSRFTIINWVNQGKIKVIRTVGRHCRIPVSEALSLLKTFHTKKPAAPAELPFSSRLPIQKINDAENCGNRLTSDKNNETLKKKNALYVFGYGIGHGVHILKGRKIK